MSKELKALERLMTNYYEMCQDLGNNDDQYQKCNLTSERAIIEKALKRLEQLELMYSNCVIQGVKQRKVLEIIKEKRVDIDLFLRTAKFNNVELYNFEIGNGARMLTKEEYGLLRGVLYVQEEENRP